MFRKEYQETTRVATTRASVTSMTKQGFFADFPDLVPQPGTMLVRTRAISARVNKNYDGFSSKELKAAYQTFMGRPSFVNHQNLNYRQTRGIVKGSVYKETGRDKYIDLAIEIDARAYPKLAAEIEAGRIDGVSMGCFLPGTLVSMADGSVQVIEKIEIDDEIITHTSKTEPVTYVMERDYAGLVYELVAYDLAPLWLTSEHPVWLRRGTLYSHAKWTVAADIQVGDWVLTPEKALAEDKEYIEGQTYPDKDGLWRRVTKATASVYEGKVFNLDVDGDDSYVAGQVAVHNCDVQRTVCSFCDNVAKDPYDFCSHILYHKGQTLERVNSNFEKESVLVYEKCEGVNFFEISFVFDPADETALVQEVYVPGGYHASVRTSSNIKPGDEVSPLPDAGIDDGLYYVISVDDGTAELRSSNDPASDSVKAKIWDLSKESKLSYDVIPKLGYGDTIAPPDVNTLRADKNCPLCDDAGFDGEKCQLCNYIAPPSELQEPDLGAAKQMDLRQQGPQAPQAPPQNLDRQARRNLSRDPFVRRS